MKKLFQYCVLYHKYETLEKGDKKYVDTVLVLEPKYALATSEKELVFKATREISEEYASDPDNVVILVRNF